MRCNAGWKNNGDLGDTKGRERKGLFRFWLSGQIKYDTDWKLLLGAGKWVVLSCNWYECWQPLVVL